VRLHTARARLARLEDRMRSAERTALDQQRTLREALLSFSSQGPLQAAGASPAAALQSMPLMPQVDQQAVESFMWGPFADMEGPLSPPSLSDAGVQSVSVAAQYESELASQAAIRTLNGRREALAAAFASEQQALASLASTRHRLLSLVRKLHHRLTAAQIAAANSCSIAGIPVTYGQWAQRFLKTIGAPVSQNNLVAMVAWQSAEGTLASYNPLATTYSMTGATDFNSVGVKNYISLAQGTEAIYLTLQAPGHGYEAILSDLQASADPFVTADAINASDWCYGCAGGQYVLDLVPVVEQYFTQFSSR
jgi:hypothetical protein